MTMNATRHFSDTRNGQGRVRFLLRGGRVHLIAEGPGWQHSSDHASLDDAALYLALLHQVPQELYETALDNLSRRLRWFSNGRAA